MIPKYIIAWPCFKSCVIEARFLSIEYILRTIDSEPQFSTEVAMAPKADENTKDKKGKWRLSNLLHPKDSEQRTSPDTEANDQPVNSTAETINSDSAYGSSGPNSTTGVPTISDSQAKAQDAEIRTSTDESTGKTITTTTTTTTTTG